MRLRRAPPLVFVRQASLTNGLSLDLEIAREPRVEVRTHLLGRQPVQPARLVPEQERAVEPLVPGSLRGPRRGSTRSGASGRRLASPKARRGRGRTTPAPRERRFRRGSPSCSCRSCRSTSPGSMPSCAAEPVKESLQGLALRLGAARSYHPVAAVVCDASEEAMSALRRRSRRRRSGQARRGGPRRGALRAPTRRSCGPTRSDSAAVRGSALCHLLAQPRDDVVEVGVRSARPGAKEPLYLARGSRSGGSEGGGARIRSRTRSGRRGRLAPNLAAPAGVRCVRLGPGLDS